MGWSGGGGVVPHDSACSPADLLMQTLPHCPLQLLSSPAFQGAASVLHQIMEMLVLTFAPVAPLLRPGGELGRAGVCQPLTVPSSCSFRQACMLPCARSCTTAMLRDPLPTQQCADEYAERVAALLFLWCVLAWLLPALLLLPGEQRQQQPDSSGMGGLRRSSRLSSSRLSGIGDGQGREASGSTSSHGGSRTERQKPSPEQRASHKAVAWVESKLRLLTCGAAKTAVGSRTGGQRDAAAASEPSCLCLLRWAATLALIWEACCLLAPLYAHPSASQ